MFQSKEFIKHIKYWIIVSEFVVKGREFVMAQKKTNKISPLIIQTKKVKFGI